MAVGLFPVNEGLCSVAIRLTERETVLPKRHDIVQAKSGGDIHTSEEGSIL